MTKYMWKRTIVFTFQTNRNRKNPWQLVFKITRGVWDTLKRSQYMNYAYRKIPIEKYCVSRKCGLLIYLLCLHIRCIGWKSSLFCFKLKYIQNMACISSNWPSKLLPTISLLELEPIEMFYIKCGSSLWWFLKIVKILWYHFWGHVTGSNTMTALYNLMRVSLSQVIYLPQQKRACLLSEGHF